MSSCISTMTESFASFAQPMRSATRSRYASSYCPGCGSTAAHVMMKRTAFMPQSARTRA
jgi:hypothetical protein